MSLNVAVAESIAEPAAVLPITAADLAATAESKGIEAVDMKNHIAAWDFFKEAIVNDPSIERYILALKAAFESVRYEECTTLFNASQELDTGGTENIELRELCGLAFFRSMKFTEALKCLSLVPENA